MIRALAVAFLVSVPGRAAAAPPKPPRVDGGYIGTVAWGAMAFTRVDGLDTPEPLTGPGGALQAGDAVFEWLTIGVSLAGNGGWARGQSVGWGGILIEAGFLPVPRIPLSIRTGFGFGAGAVLRSDGGRRFGFGGALFEGALRYEAFPLAARRRPARGGGWSIGPEIGWIGHTPAGKGRPMANTVFVGLWTGFYFGS